MICSAKYDSSVDLWSVGVILYGAFYMVSVDFQLCGHLDIIKKLYSSLLLILCCIN